MVFPPPVFPTQRQGFAETFLENGVFKGRLSPPGAPWGAREPQAFQSEQQARSVPTALRAPGGPE